MRGAANSLEEIPSKVLLHHWIVSLLIWNDSLPQWIDMTLKIISEIQIIAILGSFTFDHFASTDPSATEQLVLNIFKIAAFDFSYVFTNNDSFTKAAALIFLVYALLILALIIYTLIRFTFKKTRSSSLMKAWSFLGNLHYSIVFLVVQQFTFSLARASTANDFSIKSKMGPAILNLTLVIIVIIINLLFGVLTSKYTYYPIQGDNPLATRSATFSFAGLLFKFVQTTITTMTVNQKTRAWLGIINAILFLSFRLAHYIKELPFYHPKPLHFFLVFAAIEQTQATLNLFWGLIALGRDIECFMVLYTQIIFTYIFYKLCWSQIDKIIWKFALKPNKLLTTEDDFYRKLFALNKLLLMNTSKSLTSDRGSHNPYELLLMQIVRAHAETCLKEDCVCRIIIFDKNIELGTSMNISKAPNRERFYFEHIRDLYQTGIQHVPANSLLKLQLADLLSENDETACLGAVQLINSADCPYNSFELKILAQKLIKKVELKMQGAFFSEEFGLKVKQIINYRSAKSNFVAHVAQNTKLFNKFWEAYKAPKPSIKSLLEISKQANIDAEHIKKTWADLKRDFPRLCYKDYITYGLFLRLVRSAPFAADKVIGKYLSFIAQRHNARGELALEQTTLLDEQKIFISVSMNPLNFGYINYVSQSIETLGYTVKEVSEESITLLMTPFYARRCISFLQNQLLSGTVTLLNKSLSVMIRSKSGYIHSATLNIVPYPYLDSGLYCLAIIELSKSTEECLFVLPDGRIEAISENLAGKLHLDSQKMATCLINDICLDSHILYQYMSNGPSHSRV